MKNIYILIARYEDGRSDYIGEDYNSGGYPYFSEYPYIFSKESAKKFITFWTTETNKTYLRDISIIDLIEVNVKTCEFLLLDMVRIKPLKDV